MKYAVLVIGVVFFAFGAIDLVGSFTGFDLWGGVLGIQLPEIVWKYSAYLEMLIGYALFKIGSGMSDSEAGADEQSAQ